MGSHFLRVVDWAAAAVAGATLAKILPAVAALFTIVWTGIRIYEWARNKSILPD